MSSQPDQRRLEGSSYVDDDGSAAPAVAEALAAHAAGTAPAAAVLSVLTGGRLLVPVVAVLGEVEHDASGRARDKSSEMATVLLTGADGRRALLAFTSAEALAAWNDDARPVPAATTLAAATALQEGADALLVDVAGPVRFEVTGADLERVARGWRPVRLTDGGWAWLGTEHPGDPAHPGDPDGDWPRPDEFR